MLKNLSLILGLMLLLVTTYTLVPLFSTQKETSQLKLYWFIPDGMRAEPDLFTVYAWANEGLLPNIKKLMDNGSYGYAYPNFPSHTPTNFATLLTGAYPETHGVNDGPMRTLGKPLDSIAVGGFRSVAKKVPPIWKTLEDAGLSVSLISIPGSTPPELNKGLVVRGRWGGWGPDFAAINFETKGNMQQRIKQGRGARFFYFGPQLTEYQDTITPTSWNNIPKSFSDPREVALTAWGATTYILIYDSTDDTTTNYDRVQISHDKQTILADISVGQWSDWKPIILKWKSDNQSINVETLVKIALIKLGPGDFYRIRFFYDNLNKHVVFPDSLFDSLHQLTGPMVDFVDNFPAQLIYYPEDKKIFLDEADMSFDWHKKTVTSVAKVKKADVIIHDIYTPNQMLTSKWWMGAIDPNGSEYKNTTSEEREKLWMEVKTMYQKLDTIIGEILALADKNTYIVLSSDHGAVPLNRSVNINNLFAKKGWLSFSIDKQSGEPIIDWEKTKVIYLKMAHIYVNPKGLSGNYIRANGLEYETLRQDVIETLNKLQDEDGQNPVAEIVKWEDAKSYMHLDQDRIGDLVIANAPGFGWNEEMTESLEVFSDPTVKGYKQAIHAQDVPGMWTPFIISGPGIKRNNYLGEKPFPLVNEYPTIMKALNQKIPEFVQGEILPVFQ